MKNTVMIMTGMALGVGAYVGMEKVMKNKSKIKTKCNDLINDASDMFN